MEVTDDRLLSRLKARDSRAFEEVLRRYQVRVYSLTRGLTGNDSDAESALRDTFLDVFKNIRSLREGSKLSTRIYRAALEISWRRLRRRGQEKPVGVEALLPIFDRRGRRVAVLPDWHPLVDGLLQDRGKAVLARAWIVTLPPEERAAFVLRDQEGLSSREVAATLGWKEAAVRSSLHRARLYLRERAKRHIYSGG